MSSQEHVKTPQIKPSASILLVNTPNSHNSRDIMTLSSNSQIEILRVTPEPAVVVMTE